MSKYIKEMATNCYSARYFFTTDEFLEKENITDLEIKKAIKLELLVIEKEEKEKNQLLDFLLKTTKAFKMSQSNNKENFIIYHPCTKEKGFQISFFRNNQPISDIMRKSIIEIKKELKNYINMYDFLEETIGKTA